jgi:hypothetical protein
MDMLTMPVGLAIILFIIYFFAEFMSDKER